MTLRTTVVPYCTSVPTSSILRVCIVGAGYWALKGPEAWQDYLAFAMQICLGTCVKALHQELFIQQWVVSPQGAGCVVVQLVVVAKLCLSDRWDVLIHVHLFAHGHHDEDS